MRTLPLVVATLLFLAHQTAAALGASPFWADAWLDDLLFLPLVLGLVRLLRGRPVPLVQVAGAVVYAGSVFEGLLPRFSGRITGDPLDVAAYAAGAVLFVLLIESPRPREATA
jgi:hypothetical protein